MGAITAIEWTDATWNPVGGCSITSPGCTNCYAQRTAGTRLKDHPLYAGTTTLSKAGPVFNGRLTAAPDGHPVWTWPLRWRGSPKAKAEGRRSRIFVGDMSDLFHEDRPDTVIDRVFAVMALCPQHDFQVLTKRAERMREYLTKPYPAVNVAVECKVRACQAVDDLFPVRTERSISAKIRLANTRPLPNVWLGVSAERQKEADERIPHLLATPAAVRFVSAEPLLGPLYLTPWLHDSDCDIIEHGIAGTCTCCEPREVSINWVIVGGESGPHARPMHFSWVRSIVDQCKAAGVACFVKQMGARPVDDGGYTEISHEVTSADRKGGDMSEWPEALRVRGFPHAV